MRGCSCIRRRNHARCLFAFSIALSDAGTAPVQQVRSLSRWRRLRDAQRALFDEHGDRLRGPLALIEEATVEWGYGFRRAVELDIWLSAMGRTLVRPLLSHPSARFLQRFSGTAGNDTDLLPLAELAPTTLRRLELTGVSEHAR